METSNQTHLNIQHRQDECFQSNDDMILQKNEKKVYLKRKNMRRENKKTDATSTGEKNCDPVIYAQVILGWFAWIFLFVKTPIYSFFVTRMWSSRWLVRFLCVFYVQATTSYRLGLVCQTSSCSFLNAALVKHFEYKNDDGNHSHRLSIPIEWTCVHGVAECNYAGIWCLVRMECSARCRCVILPFPMVFLSCCGIWVCNSKGCFH